MANRPNHILEDLARMKREVEALARMKIHVGIQGDEDSEVLMIASVHEFGCTIKVTPKMKAFLHHIDIHLKPDTGYINIPERSFIRASYDTGIQPMGKVIEQLIREVVRGEKTAQQAGDAIGGILVQMTQDFVREGKVSPPISEAAKEQRASTTDTPLFDTGANIVDRITYKIEEGG